MHKGDPEDPEDLGLRNNIIWGTFYTYLPFVG